MKATVERTPEKSEAVLTITLEWTELEKASDRAYKQLAQKYTVPGFRKGHAPRSMLERMLGKDAIYHEGLEDLVESSYRDALREHDLTPVAQPTLDMPDIQHGQPYTYTAHVPILIEPTLGDYASVRIPIPSTEVSDEEVEHAIEHLREDAAEWRPVERPAQVEDQVTVDLKLTVDDKVISKYDDHEFVLAVERPGIFTGLDDHLVGMREGQSAQFETTIPEDYANPALAGKTGHYDITVKAVKVRELPDLDDEFAKTQGEFDSLEGLRTAQRERIERQKESESRRDLRDQVIKAVADQAEVVIHPAMVADETDAMLRETNRVLAQNRITLAQYLQIMNKSEEEYRAEVEPEARERVRRDLVLSAVADAEKIAIGEAEIEQWLEFMNLLGGTPMRLQDLSAGQRASIAGRLRRDKALNRLLEIATEGKYGRDEVTADEVTADEVTADEVTADEVTADEAATAEVGQAGPDAEVTEQPGVTPSAATPSAATPAGPPQSVNATPTAPPAVSAPEPSASEPSAPEQTAIRGAHEAARLGAALGGEASSVSASASGAGATERIAERQGESPRAGATERPQVPNPSETQALSGGGTEVPKSEA